ncbi:YncE family protein [Streptomyces sp. NPDC101206]|uniref:YncE family protein n=1 Tax=Streptomyces sp. NPDC101206 TaxID=3366128 RepID=UPI0037F30477
MPLLYTSNADDGSVSVVNTDSGTAEAITGFERPSAVSFSELGNHLLVCSLRSVQLVGASDSRVFGTIRAGRPSGAAISSDSRQVVVAFRDSDDIALFTSRGEERARIKVGKAPASVVFSPSRNATLVAVANSGDGTVSLVDLKQGKALGRPVKVGTEPVALAFAPDGSFLFVADRVDNTVTLLDIEADPKVLATFKVGDGPTAVTVNPTGFQACAVNSAANTVSFIDVETMQVTSTVQVGSNPSGVVFDPAGARAYVTNSGDNTITVIQPPTGPDPGKAGGTLPTGKRPTGITLNPAS